jgi:hypothetical protein
LLVNCDSDEEILVRIGREWFNEAIDLMQYEGAFDLII